jgi:hypothetical protein
MHERIYLTCLQVRSESKIECLWMFTRVFFMFYYQNFDKIQQKFSEIS